jgi:hypothetical protein
MLPYRSHDLGWCFDALLYGCVTGHIYGSDIYTDDSDVATAAIHAGFLKDGETKVVKVYTTGPQRRFAQSLRNGIQSHKFRKFAGAFTFDDKSAREVCSSSKPVKKRCVRQGDKLPAAVESANVEDKFSDVSDYAEQEILTIAPWGP